MTTIHKVAIFGASSNIGAPITAALIKAGFEVTIISRAESLATFPPGIPVIKIPYTPENLIKALTGQDAAVSVVKCVGEDVRIALVDAAEAAGVKRFVIGWGPSDRDLPEVYERHGKHRAQWQRAIAKAEANPGFTWTGIKSGIPIDWALKKFPLLGFDVTNFSATIYDKGEECFTGTTLDGIGQSVVGILNHPDETANRLVKVFSIKTSQNQLLQAFQHVTKKDWDVQRSTTKALIESGRNKRQDGDEAWAVELMVAQTFDEGEARSVVAQSREESDSELLGVAAETAEQIVAKAL